LKAIILLPIQFISNLKILIMKKWTFTILLALISLGMVNAQITYENVLIVADFEGDIEGKYTPSGWGSTFEITDNPLKEGINTSDKVFKQEREAGSWNSAIEVKFDTPVTVGDRNTIRVKVYSTAEFYLYLRPLNAAGEHMAEEWAAKPAPANEWSYAVMNISGMETIHGFRLEFSSNWGGTTADDVKVVYFDDIELSKSVIKLGEPDRTYKAVKTTEAIVIDGADMEDIWLDIDGDDIKNVNFVVAGQTAVPAQGSTFRSVYNDEALFLFIEIRDESPTAPAGTEWWNYDGIEIYLDAKGRNAPGGRLPGQYQIRINYNTETLSGQDGATVSLFMDNGMQWKQGNMVGGYTLEVKIPWKAINGGEVTTVPPMVTFDLSIADENKAIQNNRYTNVIWAGVDGTKHPYNSSEFWGAIIMEGVTSTGNARLANRLKAYPTPMNDFLIIEMENMKTFEIISITGAVVQKGNAVFNMVRVNTQELNQGMYFLRVTNKNNDIEVQKLIKK
jgi:hypothetical protein